MFNEEKKMMKHKDSIYYIFFKLHNQPFSQITTKEYDMILNDMILFDGSSNSLWY